MKEKEINQLSEQLRKNNKQTFPTSIVEHELKVSNQDHENDMRTILCLAKSHEIDDSPSNSK